MHFRNHLLAPVTNFGRLRWVNLEAPDQTPAPEREMRPIPAPEPSVPAPAAGSTFSDPDPRASIAGLERPVDLAVLVVANRDEATITQALAMLPASPPCAVILSVTEGSLTEDPPRDLHSLASAHAIAEADHEEILIPGHVWVAPSGRVLTLARRGQAVHTLLLHPAANDGRGALDALLGSAAESFGERVLVVILSGSAPDGVEGCTRIRSAGGRIIQATPDMNERAPLSAALAAARLSHGSWPHAELGSIVRDCILHGRHDPRRARDS